MTEHASAGVGTATVIPGVRIHHLDTHEDARGSFTEIFRTQWPSAIAAVQWNAVTSRAGTLRGVHVHVLHADYLVVVSGRMWLGLKDLRGTAGYGAAPGTVVELAASRPMAVSIPPGVAHGFLFGEESMHIYAVSEYFDPADELGCLWSDAALAIPWPFAPSRLSERDAGLPSLSRLREQLVAHAVQA